MQLSVFGYTALMVLIGAPIVAVAGLVTSIRRHSINLFDVGGLLLPPFAFIVVGIFRPLIHVGWAMFLWPILIAVAVMYLFALRVLLVDRGKSKTRAPSVAFFAFSVGVALTLGATVPPWYE